MAGGLVGETFANIIGFQFFKLKFADRFYYERRDTTIGFTESMLAPFTLTRAFICFCLLAAQLSEIRKASLSGILCATTPLNEIQVEALKMTNSR